jgi:hypothetical protein
MNPIIEILMERDGLSYDEAQEVFDEAKAEADAIIDNNTGDENAMSNLLDMEDILFDYFGLEPDYLFDLIEI